MLDDCFLDDNVGTLEGLVDVSPTGHGPVERLVVLDFPMQLRRSIVYRRLGIDDCFEWLVVHIDPLKRVVCLVLRLGHDDCHDVADVPHGVLCDTRVVGDLQVGVR